MGDNNMSGVMVFQLMYLKSTDFMPVRVAFLKTQLSPEAIQPRGARLGIIHLGSAPSMQPCVVRHTSRIVTSAFDHQPPRRPMSWQTLTPELVFEIFRHFLPGLTLSITQPKLFPWYLGQICSSWRGAFISHAGFWSNLIIHLEYIDESLLIHDIRDANRALQILNLCLPRSNDRPLSFKFTQRLLDLSFGLDRIPISTCCRQILDLLMEHSTRWGDAYIELPKSQLSILYKVKDKLPLLRSMQIQLSSAIEAGDGGWDSFTIHPPPNYENLFENAPQLRRIHIASPSWKMNWSALTVIHFHYPSWVGVHLDILSRASHLEELTIYGSFVIPILRNTIPPTTLPFLKILRIGCESALLLFRTPILQELCIGNTYLSAGNEFSDTISICLPSLVHLTKLTLFATTTSYVEILLQHMPALPHLSLYVNDTDCLKLLSECPKLRCLKTLTVGLSSSDENQLANIAMWMKRKSLPNDVHGFEELEYLSLELFAIDGHSHIAAVVKEHLEAEGIRNSIQQLHTAAHTKFALFDDLFQC